MWYVDFANLLTCYRTKSSGSLSRSSERPPGTGSANICLIKLRLGASRGGTNSSSKMSKGYQSHHKMGDTLKVVTPTRGLKFLPLALLANGRQRKTEYWWKRSSNSGPRAGWRSLKICTVDLVANVERDGTMYWTQTSSEGTGSGRKTSSFWRCSTKSVRSGHKSRKWGH